VTFSIFIYHFAHFIVNHNPIVDADEFCKQLTCLPMGLLLLLLLLAVGGGGDRFLSHHELRPSVGPVLNPYPTVYACVCVSAQGRGVRICICICVCCEQSLSSLF